LHALGSRLSQLPDRRDEALAATAEAVDIYRSFTDRDPELHLPRLAVLLHGQGAARYATGDVTGAAAAFQEAVTILRPMVERNPDSPIGADYRVVLDSLRVTLGGNGSAP
jgi:hypothetical protein